MATIPQDNRFNKLISEWQDFYGVPLDRAIVYLHDVVKLTYGKIAEILYEGEISKQAIYLRYKNLKQRGVNSNV